MIQSNSIPGPGQLHRLAGEKLIHESMELLDD